MDHVSLNFRPASLGGYRVDSTDENRPVDVANIVSKAIQLISEPGLVVKNAPKGADKLSGASDNILDETPELEDVELDGYLRERGFDMRNASHLEKLVLYLRLENDELRSRQAQERIETEKAELEKRHTEMRNKINDNIKAMKEAAHQALLQKILGWVMVGVMLVAAAVTAGAAIAAAAAASAVAAGTATATTTAAVASISASTTAATTTAATGAAATGAAATAGVTTATTLTTSWGIAKVVVLNATALLGLTNQILTEKGTMKELQDKLAETLRRNHHMSEEKSQMTAQIIMGAATAVVMVGGGIFGGGATAQAMKFLFTMAQITQATTKALQTSMLVASVGMGAGTLAQQGVSIDAQYDQGLAGADVQEVRAMLQLVAQMLDETQEELQQILEQIQGLLGKMFDVISSALDAEKEIANNTGAMA